MFVREDLQSLRQGVYTTPYLARVRFWNLPSGRKLSRSFGCAKVRSLQYTMKPTSLCFAL